jgi:hypothetical protein
MRITRREWSWRLASPFSVSPKRCSCTIWSLHLQSVCAVANHGFHPS